LEVWVADLDRTRGLLTTAFGFQLLDPPADPPAEPAAASGESQQWSAYLVSGEVRIILRQDPVPTGPIGRHVSRHGDTVADVALTCPDPAALAGRAARHGLSVSGTADAPTVDLFGDRTVCHTLRRTSLVPRSAPAADATPIRSVDHLGYCLPWGFVEPAARAYEQVFGLHRLAGDSFDAIGDQATGMRSIVLRAPAGLTVVLTEPISQASTGQTQRFIDAHAGPGVQHAALTVDDLFTTVAAMRARGVTFLPIPDRYYDQAEQRLAHASIPWPALRRQEILVDADHDGLLYQLFTRPVTRRGTFFFELITRQGATGFGVNNVRALFEAIQATIDKEP
jgi:4-hydroxymandelate synthase